LKFDYAYEFGGCRDTQAKGRAKKLWSLENPIFLNGRSVPLAGGPQTPSLHGSSFTTGNWIGHGIGKASIKKDKGMVLYSKKVYPAIENGGIRWFWTN